MGGRFCHHRPGQCTADPAYQAEIAARRRPAEVQRPSVEPIDTATLGPVRIAPPPPPNIVERARARLVAAIERCSDEDLPARRFLAEQVRLGFAVALPSWLALDLLIAADREDDRDAPTPAERYCLGLMAEEFGEVLQWIGKGLRFGLDSPRNAEHPDETPRGMLPAEMGDAAAAIDFAKLHQIVPRGTVSEAHVAKLSKLLDAGRRVFVC